MGTAGGPSVPGRYKKSGPRGSAPGRAGAKGALWVKLRKSRSEHFLFAVPRKAAVQCDGRFGKVVPPAKVAALAESISGDT